VQGIQAFDRYSFVNNNPLRYIDPTGNALESGCDYEGCFTNDEDLEKYNLEYYYGKPTLKPKQTPTDDSQESEETPGPPPIQSTPVPPPPNNYLSGEDLIPYYDPDDPDFLADFSEFELELILAYFDKLLKSEIVYYGYRLGKGATFLPAVEGIASGLLQALRDQDNNLTTNQKIVRAIVVGGESTVTDLLTGGIATFVGSLASPTTIIGSGIAGQVALFASNAAIEILIVDPINRKYFPIWNLGEY
jgi:hypothetical protein